MEGNRSNPHKFEKTNGGKIFRYLCNKLWRETEVILTKLKRQMVRKISEIFVINYRRQTEVSLTKLKR